MNGNGQLVSGIDRHNNELIKQLIDNLQTAIQGIFYLKIIFVTIGAMFILSFFIWPEFKIAVLIMALLFVFLWVVLMFGLERDKKFSIQDLRFLLLKDRQFRNSVPSFRNHVLIRKYVPELVL